MEREGFFSIFWKDDGTYVRFIPPEGAERWVDFEEVKEYLELIHVVEYDVMSLYHAYQRHATTEFKLLNEKLLPEDEKIVLNLDPEGRQATVKFYPPTMDGHLLSREDIVKHLVQNGIKYGLQEYVLNQFLAERHYCKKYIIAKATMPEQGRASQITYHFNDTNIAKPKVNEDGSVDFHELGNIQHVTKDQLLATLTPAYLGKPGIDILGRIIKPAKVDDTGLKFGRNISLSEDKCSIYSMVSGHVMLADGTVFVSDNYKVPADVDASTGDIHYDGNVEVTGNVKTGYLVEATGDIIVNGVVEGATLIAGGQIILQRGIQGMYRGKLEAHSNVVAKFIENSEVESGGYVMTDAIMHSTIIAKEEITVDGKRGLIAGGRVISGKLISAKVAGATMGSQTILEIGSNPKTIERHKVLEDEIKQLNEELEKWNQLVGILKKKMQSGKSQEFLLKLKGALEKITELNQQHDQKNEECTALGRIIASEQNGRIKVENMVYPGVKVVIGRAAYHVNENMRRKQFLKEKGMIYITTFSG